MPEEVRETIKGDGYAVSSVGAIGDGPGFRKIRRELDVTAFGVNVIVLPEGYDAGTHYHEEQEELYLVLRGTIEIEFPEQGRSFTLSEGGLARVDPKTPRHIRNAGSGEAAYFIVGGKDGYVGRDGRTADGDKVQRAGQPQG
jgi:mannose-6-phosphate isomerase-like protein (cupin superfamily)